jgi:alpha-methylacyl-CoA racemase
MSLTIDEHLAKGVSPGPGHDVLTGRYAFYDTYQCRDGKWLSVGAIEGHFYQNLCKALGCEQWQEHQYDDAVQDRVRTDFAAAFAGRDRDDWVSELAPANTCVAPVYSIEELAQDPHLQARGAFTEAHHAEHGRFRQVGPVLAGMEQPQGAVPVRDASQTDTDELLREVGMAEAEITAMREQGIIS